MNSERTERNESGGGPELDLRVELAGDRRDVLAAQMLRHRVFFAERGVARGAGAAIDADRFDPFCDHLIVRGPGGEIVGTYRMLTAARAAAAGGFYSQHEFDIEPLRPLLGEAVEIGRACVDPRFRGGAVIALLWSGLIRYLVAGGYRYVMGCASIAAEDEDEAARVCRRLLSKHPIGLPQPVRPHRPFDLGDGAIAGSGSIPALIKAYLRMGATLCGPPAFDPEFRTADFLMLLDLARLDRSHVDRVRRSR